MKLLGCLLRSVAIICLIIIQRNLMPRLSIIYTHWAQNEFRSELMRKSIETLVATTDTEEILVADNGGSLSDSQFLLGLCEDKKIAMYMRFRENMHFAYTRNALLDFATGEYIAIVDNDIVFEPGWWQECLSFLDKNQDLAATPLVPDLAHRIRRFWVGERDGWQLNARAGSPCFIMHRSLWEKVGKFEYHNMAGSKFADALVRNKAYMAIMPQCKAVDLGERKGYDWKNPTYSKQL